MKFNLNDRTTGGCIQTTSSNKNATRLSATTYVILFKQIYEQYRQGKIPFKTDFITCTALTLLRSTLTQSKIFIDSID